MDWNVRFIFSGWIWDNLFDSSLTSCEHSRFWFLIFSPNPNGNDSKTPRNRNLNRFFSESPSGVDVVLSVKITKKIEIFVILTVIIRIRNWNGHIMSKWKEKWRLENFLVWNWRLSIALNQFRKNCIKPLRHTIFFFKFSISKSMPSMHLGKFFETSSRIKNEINTN
jgi:hypothetical protein